jgi:hypothetical protein
MLIVTGKNDGVQFDLFPFLDTIQHLKLKKSVNFLHFPLNNAHKTVSESLQLLQIFSFGITYLNARVFFIKYKQIILLEFFKRL